MGNEMTGVMIDNLISEEDMEVKPLPSHIRNSDLSSGATITGKGDVVILPHAPIIMEKSKIIHVGKQSRPVKDEDKRRGIEVGADAYIIKGSFDQSNLMATVQNLI